MSTNAAVKHDSTAIKADQAKEKAALASIAQQQQAILDSFSNATTPPSLTDALGQMFALGEKQVQTKDHFESVIAGDKKHLAHDQAAAKKDRKQALKDLKPAEYHLGLKETNRDRKELGLAPVKKVIRPAGPGHVTPAMRRLAADAKKVALSMGGYHGLGLCATGVSRAIRQATGIAVYGNGNQIDNNLPKSKFKQLHIPLAQALKTPGLILTWEHTSTALGAKYGHTAVTLGDGHSSASDFIELNTLAGNASRTGLKIFLPLV